mgnify:CR=1 FL=1
MGMDAAQIGVERQIDGRRLWRQAVIAAGGGLDRVEGGDGSWIDRLNIQDMRAPGEGDWTVVLDQRATPIQNQRSLS